MKEVRGYPPNFEEIVKVFPAAQMPGTLFCWGDTIFNPSGVDLPLHIIVHEKVHCDQQKGKPGEWWERYLADPAFRLDQEIPAHIAEYRQYCLGPHARNMRRVMLNTIAMRLSGPLYGNMIWFGKAWKLIKEGAKQ